MYHLFKEVLNLVIRIFNSFDNHMRKVFEVLWKCGKCLFCGKSTIFAYHFDYYFNNMFTVLVAFHFIDFCKIYFVINLLFLLSYFLDFLNYVKNTFGPIFLCIYSKNLFNSSKLPDVISFCISFDKFTPIFE